MVIVMLSSLILSTPLHQQTSAAILISSLWVTTKSLVLGDTAVNKSLLITHHSRLTTLSPHPSYHKNGIQ